MSEDQQYSSDTAKTSSEPLSLDDKKSAAEPEDDELILIGGGISVPISKATDENAGDSKTTENGNPGDSSRRQVVDADQDNEGAPQKIIHAVVLIVLIVLFVVLCAFLIKYWLPK